MSGFTINKFFIASSTELGESTPYGGLDGAVLDWFADPSTAGERRIEASNSPVSYWARTGMWGTYEGVEYDSRARIVDADGGIFSGPWVTDNYGVMPMFNLAGDALFLQMPDGSFRLLPF